MNKTLVERTETAEENSSELIGLANKLAKNVNQLRPEGWQQYQLILEIAEMIESGGYLSTGDYVKEAYGVLLGSMPPLPEKPKMPGDPDCDEKVLHLAKVERYAGELKDHPATRAFKHLQHASEIVSDVSLARKIYTLAGYFGKLDKLPWEKFPHQGTYVENGVAYALVGKTQTLQLERPG